MKKICIHFYHFDVLQTTKISSKICVILYKNQFLSVSMYVGLLYISSVLILGPPNLAGWYRISPSEGYGLFLVSSIEVRAVTVSREQIVPFFQ